MHISFNQIIRVTRGDTENISLASIIDNAKEVIAAADAFDTFYMGIMEPGQLFEDAILKKVVRFSDIVDNKVIFHFDSEDTENLLPGKYYYSIKQGNTETGETQVLTLVPNTIFWLE